MKNDEEKIWSYICDSIPLRASQSL